MNAAWWLRRGRWLAWLVFALLALEVAHASPMPAASGFTIDPATVQRWGAGWRYPQAGWTGVHIEGAPRERGLQHGHLLAPEIAAYIRALSEFWGPKTPAAAWAQNCRVAQTLFGQGFPPEQMQEMQGIVHGANAAGARAWAQAGCAGHHRDQHVERTRHAARRAGGHAQRAQGAHRHPATA